MVKLVKPQIDVGKALEEAALEAAADTAAERLRAFLEDEKDAMDFVGRFQILDWGDAEGAE